MTWVARLLPKEELFFPLFEQHADRLSAGAHALRRLLQGGAELERYCEELNSIDKEASTSTRKVLDGVRSTFIAPFDRVAIKSLIMEMDGCLHDMRKTGRAVSLFQVDRFEPCMHEIADVIVECARLVNLAMPLLADVDGKAVEITDMCREITAQKERSGELADRGVKALFQSKGGEPMSFIVNNMVYEHLEAVVDRLETVGNSIHDVVIDQV